MSCQCNTTPFLVKMSWVLILPNGTQAAHSEPRNTLNDKNIPLLVVLHKPTHSGTRWVLPEIPQHHLQEAKGSTAPLEQPWKLGWDCRNQQHLEMLVGANLKRRAGLHLQFKVLSPPHWLFSYSQRLCQKSL